jgi:peptidoglycan hydrolase-like protein with peptidoglycan-binding domain
METLSYLYLATTDESADNLHLRTTTFDLTRVKAFNWKKLPSAAWIQVGAIAIAFTLIGMASHSALALQIGNQGSQITTLQQNLATSGFYKGPITGFYGELTQSAVRRFQQAKGLPVDGIAGPDTLSALNGTSGSRLPTGILLQPGSRGTAVTQLQKTLTAKGFYKGPVTGYYGELTQSAVRRFQQATGLLADGIAGRTTLAALLGNSLGGSAIALAPQG